MDSFEGNFYARLMRQLKRECNISQDLSGYLSYYHYLMDSLIGDSDEENRYSKPMPWIGMYIAIASLFCILAMVGDLIHGFRNRKLWFPCKYFTMNATSLTVIAIAMKLPVDLNNPMPGDIDQTAKVGSMAFMCTMMANFLPSLATMDNKELLTNIIALVILVITVVVNICIQINTGVVSPTKRYSFVSYYTWLIAIIYIAMLLVLLIIYICTALTILKSKQILQLKYQAGHETALIELKRSGRVTVEKIKQHVSNYWIMAGTGNPEFITTCSATTSASGVICVVSSIPHVTVVIYMWQYLDEHTSNYKWSIVVILTVQFFGVVLGTIAPLCRCFASLSFKLSINWIWNHIKVFKVESYWTQKLRDWKHSSIPFSISCHKCKVVIENLKRLILSFCIALQKTVVVACKMIALIPIFFMICVFYCLGCWKWLKSVYSASGPVLGENTKQPEQNEDLQPYVLQLQDDMEVAERTLKALLKSLKRLIKKSEKRQPNNLMNLLQASCGFEGVGKYVNHQVPTLLSEQHFDCWSLPLVTLTTISISLPNIQSSIRDRLLSSVSEGLLYVTLVEESLNDTDEYLNIQKAAKLLWLEVEIYRKWLGHNLKNLASQANTAGQILEWFKNTAINNVTEVELEGMNISNENSTCISICANSMYRITQSILLSYNTNIEEVSHEELFAELSSMIADIFAACLTNLPQVIAKKCHEISIEKREASVHAAAQLLGETMQIINYLQERELPCLNPDELAFIDKWRAYAKHPFPY